MALLAVSDTGVDRPNRRPLPDRLVAVRFTPLPLAASSAGSLRLVGAWTVAAGDPRFFGLSALAVRGNRLLALTDSGVTIDLPKPGDGTVTRLHDLPDGPGFATYKKYRDSEGLLQEAGGGWLVTFEYRHSLWRFDQGFTQGAQVADLSVMRWPKNDGVEALVGAPGGGLLLFPESTRGVLLLRDGRATLLPLVGRTGGIADAVTLPDGRIMVAVRDLGLGIGNRLAWLEREGLGYRLVTFATLPLGWLDNVEGLAAERLPGGGTRVWAVTDNDDWRRTVLLEMELPPERATRARQPTC
ncbi:MULTISPECIES: esterase-like activity of phytase family protein [Sphingomonas]|uniref:esterase-like activity of phytase family protein n=1 Tax=Sphingomonas TaxID=13687 RepID=UPI0014458B8B|nr:MULTISPECIES: esterase-like activity of phytase family protein [Sphingomonas]